MDTQQSKPTHPYHPGVYGFIDISKKFSNFYKTIGQFQIQFRKSKHKTKNSFCNIIELSMIYLIEYTFE